MSQGPDPIELAARSIQHLKIEFEKFFSGAEAIPPEALRLSVEEKIRKLRQGQLNSVDAFRVASLEARFNSYSEMFLRRLRRLEEGRPLRPQRVAKTRRGKPMPDPSRGVRLGLALEKDGVEALYDGLYRGTGSVDLETFRNHLAKNLAAIHQRTGCREAVFRLVTEDGRPKLRVKPIASSRDAAAKE